MRGYSTRDVAELLGLTPPRIRSFARAGFLSPAKSPSGQYRFSFQDIILLRTAKELDEAQVQPRTLMRALRALREQLPNGQSLAALRVTADGDRVVVREQDTVWNPESGQIQLDFSVSELAGKVTPLLQSAARDTRQNDSASSEDWFELGADFEAIGEIEEARAAYFRALELDADNPEANINLGRLLHAEGNASDAADLYRTALATSPNHATASYNLAVALEDMDSITEAIASYRQALVSDPDFADAHYNLAQLYERNGDQRAALRHLQRYRALAD